MSGITLSDELLSNFNQVANERGDDPDATLERMLQDYINRSDMTRKIDEIHAVLVVEGEDADVTTFTESLSDYDPEDPQPVSKSALTEISEYDACEIQIDRNDVNEIPGTRLERRRLIRAIARYECDAITKAELTALADDLIGLESDYYRNEYVDKIWEKLIRSGFDHKLRFTDNKAALAYMDQLLEDDDEVNPVEIDQITGLLAREYRDNYEMAVLNEYREQVNLDPM
ncbi:hypothetical protein [Natronosalvus vescus]|uniref:hypothetical protein n=1 Tax=Natronosalvus vescus TaxID=2953881 RepID=UPI002091832C|nr:hypothetical protein [Natronosalvus vescus]